MIIKKQGKLELTWVGKDERPRLEPRILIEDPTKSYGDPRTENMLIFGDNLLALRALEPVFDGNMDFYLNLLNDKEARSRRQAFHRHHPLCGKGRRAGGIRPALESKPHRGVVTDHLQTKLTRRSEGETAYSKAACWSCVDGAGGVGEESLSLMGKAGDAISRGCGVVDHHLT